VRSLAKALITLSPALLLGQGTVEFFAVDRCLDRGNVYDYAQGVCRSDVITLPYVPYLERSWPWVVAASVCLALGVLLLLTSRRKST